MAVLALIAACGSDDKTGSGPEDPTTTRDATDPSNLLVTGLRVKDVAVFQGVKVPVVENGDTFAGDPKAPVVANRQGVIRVYVSADSTFKKGASVTAELHLVAPDGTDLPTVKETKPISGDSTEEDKDSTFNLEFPASSFPAGVSFQVWLTATDGVATPPETESDARYPQDGTLWQDAGAQASGKVKIVLVPIKYTADGSNRLPTTTAEQLDLTKKEMMAIYPASDIEITLHDPLDYDQEISGSDPDSFSTILETIRNLRKTDKVADDIYYFGQFAPAKTFAEFCAQGCVAGLSTVATSAGAASLRASVGIGFPGDQSAETLAHEIGHAHGRNHAPCGNPAGVDQKFPYKDAFIGAWGYNIFTKEFLSPKVDHDMMAYCDNNWVSDYTYNALFNRIVGVNKLMSEPSAEDAQIIGEPVTEAYTLASVDAKGNLRYQDEVPATHRILGIEKKATLFGESGNPLGTAKAQFFPYDHAAGGVLYIPKHANDAPWKSIDIEGAPKRLLLP